MKNNAKKNFLRSALILFIVLALVLPTISCTNPDLQETNTDPQETDTEHEHTYGESKTVKNPSFSEEGLKQSVCVECGYTKEEPICLSHLSLSCNSKFISVGLC